MRQPDRVRRVACPDCGAKPASYCLEGDRLRLSNHASRIRAHKVAYPPRGRPLPPPGVRANFTGVCPRCGREVHEAQVVPRKGEWICPSCAPGGDDE